MATYRLQKILARGGLASRRKAEELISAGRVRVNGRIVTELGAQADPIQDKIEVDGKRVIAEPLVYVVLHKPRGVVSTMSDPEGRPTVKDYLGRVPGRVYSVGRLDFATSGVLLATNDGDFSDALLHPRKSVPKTYVVKVVGEMQEKDLERWAQGVRLDDGMTRPADLVFHRHEDGKTWFELTIREGRNQQIRRMGEATGFPVMRLARISFAGISSENLRPGDFRHLTRDELMDLRKEYGVPKKLPTLPTAVLESRTKRPARAPTTDRHGRAESRNETHDGRKAGVSRAPRPERPQRASRPHDREERPTRASRSPDGSHIREAIDRTFEKPSRRPTTERRPSSDRAPRERPFNDRAARERPTNERASRERPARERPTTERRPSSDRGPRERPFNDRAARERPTNERASRERPGRERPSTERRPSSERASRERPFNDRAARERPTNERASRERPGRERPSTERRPSSDRASRERPASDRTSRERRPTDRTSRERPAKEHHPKGRPPMERRHPAGGPPASSRPSPAEPRPRRPRR
ncbi:pseudouridine synthase [Pendulispora rubella]|uniref:Pseudouridine synthase n=1 Tax=Pendulispora rubella TaxID=2741070 RepID=A0ABZ2LDU7_9BACT